MGYIMDLRELVRTRPLVMVGANVILLDGNDRILLQLRSDNGAPTRFISPIGGVWGLPGRALELGESLEEVAKRELFEETGLSAKRLTLFNVFSGEEFYCQYPNGDEVYNVITTYICTDYRGSLRKDNEEVKELKFFSLDDLPESINPLEVAIIKAFLESELM